MRGLDHEGADFISGLLGGWPGWRSRSSSGVPLKVYCVPGQLLSLCFLAVINTSCTH